MPESDHVPGGIAERGDREQSLGVGLGEDRATVRDDQGDGPLDVRDIDIREQSRLGSREMVADPSAAEEPAGIVEARPIAVGTVDAPAEHVPVERRRPANVRGRNVEIGDRARSGESGVDAVPSPSAAGWLACSLMMSSASMWM